MSSHEGRKPSSDPLFDVDSNDPDSMLIDRTGLSEEDVGQIGRLMGALAGLRRAEELLSEAANSYMKLNRTDMRALHFLIVSEHRGELVTPGALAVHLGVSTASITKLLDRLERAGHITRAPHPSDRRALSVRITPATRRSAMETVGAQQARRFYAAARLSPAGRELVIGFLQDMTAELSLDGVEWAARP